MIVKVAKWMKRNSRPVRVWPPWPASETVWEARFDTCSKGWFVIVAALGQFFVGAGAAIVGENIAWPWAVGITYFAAGIVMLEALSAIRRAVRGEFDAEDWGSTTPKFSRNLKKARENAGIKQHEEI